MPAKALRPHIIALLMDANFKRRPDTGTWSHLDGRPFTKEEQAAALDATRYEFEAAVEEFKRYAAAVRAQDDAVAELTDLLLHYFTKHPEAKVVDELIPHMTDEDLRTFKRLSPIAAPGGGFFLPYND